MRLVGLLVLLPVVAFGAGFYTSVNGSKTLLEGGTGVGEADDVSAIQHNPAGLAQTRGFSFMLDGQLINHSITFQREDTGFDPANPPATNVQPVSNQGGPFVVPMLGVAYGFPLFDRTLTIALGVYGPPSVGHYAFNAPDYTRDMTTGKYEADPRKFAPERYALISNNILIVFPTLSIAYAVHPKILLGVSLQPVVGSFSFSQAVSNFPGTPKNQAAEDPSFDALVNVNLPIQSLAFTGIAGVLIKPSEFISFGASLRPPVPLTATGSLSIDAGEAAKELGTTITGGPTGTSACLDTATALSPCQTRLQMTLPAEFKAGVHLQPTTKLGFNIDYVFEGWESIQQIVLTPLNVSKKIGSGAPSAVTPFNIEKGWGPSFQIHVGAGFALFKWLSLHAGAWYESGAIPDSTIGVDFMHFAEVVITGGIGLHFFGLDIYAGAAGSPTVTHAVTTSNARAGTTDPTIMGGVIGNGLYTTGSFMATLGIRGHFGGGGGSTSTPAPAPGT